MSSDSMSALEQMFGGKKVSEVVAEAPTFELIPDNAQVEAEVASIKIEEKNGKWVMNVALQITTPEHKNRFMYANYQFAGNIPQVFDRETIRKENAQVAGLLDFLYETYVISDDGKIINHAEPNGIAVAAALGRTVKFKVRHSEYQGKKYANPGFLFNLRKAGNEIPCAQSTIPRLVNPGEKQQRLSRRIDNDAQFLQFFKVIPSLVIAEFIEDRLKGFQAIPRGTEITAQIDSAKSGTSAAGNATLTIVWKVLGGEFSNRTIKDTITLKTSAEKVSNLFSATGLIQDDVLQIPAGLTPEEALVGKKAVFYTGVNEWQGREYTTVDTDYFPVE